MIRFLLAIVAVLACCVPVEATVRGRVRGTPFRPFVGPVVVAPTRGFVSPGFSRGFVPSNNFSRGFVPSYGIGARGFGGTRSFVDRFGRIVTVDQFGNVIAVQ